MITNKTQSDAEIKRRKLNHTIEGVFVKGQKAELESFLNQNSYPFYNIRDKSQSRGKFRYKLTKDEVIARSVEYDRFSVYESLWEADERLVIQGDIFINNSFELIASLDSRKNIPLRSATNNPMYMLSIDLKERREPSIPGLTEAIDFIVKHELFNIYVEISVFEIPVGIKRENIIIWELRNY